MSEIGVIFDWDGVIIDSHDQHRDSWYALAAELDQPLTDKMFAESFGMRNESILVGLFGWVKEGDHETLQRLADRKEDLYRDSIRKDGIEPLPGVREFLAELKSKQIPCCVGTSTPRENVLTVLEVTGMADLFNDIASAEDVTRGKPEPDVFLLAAEKISRSPSECVVFEDAHVGLEAAKRAGMRRIGVSTTHPAESLEAAIVIADLSEIDVSKLLQLWD